MNFSKVRLYITFFILITSIFLTSCQTVGPLEEHQQQYTSMESFFIDKGYPSFDTTTPEFFYTGRDWNAKSLALIEEAKESIILSTFLGVTDISTVEVWQALANKAASGVKVYVIIDSSSNIQVFPHSREVVQSAFIYLKELGVNFVEYNSMSVSNIFFLPSLLDRDHRKYWVIDSSIVAVGGININHTSLNHPKGLGNIDIMGVVTSPSLAHYITSLFVETYNRYSPTHISLHDFSYQDESFSKDQQLHTAWAFDHYYQQRSVIKDMFDAFAFVAEEEIWMVQGYSFLSPALIKRIQYMLERGVKVNFILSKYATQEKYEKASFYSIVDLLEAGATVYVYDSPEKAFLHQKVIVADNRYSSFGSANYNFRSHTISRELNLVYDDEEIASNLMTFIDSLIENSTKVDLEYAKEFRTFSYFLTNLIMQVWG